MGEPPALLTSTSSRPKCSTALAIDRLGVRRLADVGRHEHRPLDLGLVPPARDDVRPGLDERRHDPGPDPARPARHHDHALAEVERRLRHGANPRPDLGNQDGVLPSPPERGGGQPIAAPTADPGDFGVPAASRRPNPACAGRPADGNRLALCRTPGVDRSKTTDVPGERVGPDRALA